jgi:hypothetical protein
VKSRTHFTKAQGPPRLILTTVLLPGEEICLALIASNPAIVLLLDPTPLSDKILTPYILLQEATPTEFPPTVPVYKMFNSFN